MTTRKTAVIVDVDCYRDAGTGLTPAAQRQFIADVVEIVREAIPRQRIASMLGPEVDVQVIGESIYGYFQGAADLSRGIEYVLVSETSKSVAAALRQRLGSRAEYCKVR